MSGRKNFGTGSAGSLSSIMTALNRTNTHDNASNSPPNSNTFDPVTETMSSTRILQAKTYAPPRPQLIRTEQRPDLRKPQEQEQKTETSKPMLIQRASIISTVKKHSDTPPSSNYSPHINTSDDETNDVYADKAQLEEKFDKLLEEFETKKKEILKDAAKVIDTKNWDETMSPVDLFAERIADHIVSESKMFLACLPKGKNDNTQTLLIHPGFDLPKIFRRVGNLAHTKGYQTDNVIAFRDYENGIPKMRANLRFMGIKAKKPTAVKPEGATAYIYICCGYDDHCIPNDHLQKLIKECVSKGVAKVNLVLGHYDNPTVSIEHNEDLYPTYQHIWRTDNEKKLLDEFNNEKNVVEIFSVTDIFRSESYKQIERDFIELVNADKEMPKKEIASQNEDNKRTQLELDFKNDIEKSATHLAKLKASNANAKVDSSANSKDNSPRLHLTLSQPTTPTDTSTPENVSLSVRDVNGVEIGKLKGVRVVNSGDQSSLAVTVQITDLNLYAPQGAKDIITKVNGTGSGPSTPKSFYTAGLTNFEHDKEVQDVTPSSALSTDTPTPTTPQI